MIFFLILPLILPLNQTFFFYNVSFRTIVFLLSFQFSNFTSVFLHFHFYPTFNYVSENRLKWNKRKKKWAKNYGKRLKSSAPYPHIASPPVQWTPLLLLSWSPPPLPLWSLRPRAVRGCAGDGTHGALHRSRPETRAHESVGGTQQGAARHRSARVGVRGWTSSADAWIGRR